MKFFLIGFLLIFNNLWSQNIYWSENQKLVWDNFKSKTNNLGGSTVVAYTHCGWEYSATTSSDPKIPVKITIQTVFNENKSWKDVKRINDYVLLHEQKHFDIAEIHARKLRKEVSEKIKTTADYNKLFKIIYAKISSEYKGFQTDYDRITEHGMNKEKQAEYNILIAEELNNLKNFQKI
ncbi:DUF922 domain-containing protein [Chryseobacterium turcicum]|uniref:DUF922 domain-containing Zn-dependent protease n=1 Tax=Chryseobacterium turcicum TaxID=2898076 RepID=A0A9Q3V439_9FLAO|nr:DUF922 domain-containing protein [Chryseobacterium turcicum]MCD1117338.1 DUF922 domain-containing Zn-dependent protease [Chryseobacterium turcicum]